MTGHLTRSQELRGERILALLETPRTGAGHDAARAAVRRGVTPVILLGDPTAVDESILDGYRSLGAALVPCDTGSAAAVVRTCRMLASQNELAGLTCVYEYYVHRAAEAARELGLAGPSPDAVRICRSKLQVRTALAGRGGLNPAYAVAGDPAEAGARAAEIGLPVVLKPVSLTGGAYVRRCDDVAATKMAAAEILSVGSYHGTAVDPVVLIEEFLDGPEFSVEMFDGSTVGVTAKEVAGRQCFVEMAHTYPAQCPPELRARVSATAETAVAAVGLDRGPAHVEVKVDSRTDRAVLIEINPRPGGDRIPELVRLAEGVDLSAALVDSLLGLPVDLAVRQRQVAVIRFVPTPQRGRLSYLGGFQDAQQVEGVVEVQMEPEVGGYYIANGSNRDRVVHVIALADTADRAHRAARTAIDRLTIRWVRTDGELR